MLDPELELTPKQKLSLALRAVLCAAFIFCAIVVLTFPWYRLLPRYPVGAEWGAFVFTVWLIADFFSMFAETFVRRILTFWAIAVGAYVLVVASIVLLWVVFASPVAPRELAQFHTSEVIFCLYWPFSMLLALAIES